MKKLLLIPFALICLTCCTNDKKEKAAKEDKRITLRTDTINVVRLTDTLIIYESTCRGYAYEQSTHFDISDSLGIVKLLNVVTTDNNSAEMNGGSISKNLILVPLKTGATTFKLYKFWKEQTTAEDSARSTLYKIEVRN